MDVKLKTKALRTGTRREGDLFYRVVGWREKYALLSFSANYGHGTSTFQMWLKPSDFENIIRGMLEANRDAAVLAIGNALAATFEPTAEKE
ncbi:MAG TPA: hypothetical protein GXX48_24525 [Ochrobactrum intermedium]|uniref:Uncharacterized protein n=1 Tax=Brucella intermedia TaxID=94625 RepID=A0A7V6U2E9_9HYPH|nr:hypothetical protein [Brucella intermedia]HHV70762.1 hypothetical protein [Brucella intermedia]